jgi:hypothetical protein
MCHLLQNSAIFLEKYGKEKFFTNSIPRSLATPEAMSEYPEKSQYIWKVKKKAPKNNVLPE